MNAQTMYFKTIWYGYRSSYGAFLEVKLKANHKLDPE